jgi:hypothetical protein
MKRYSNRPYGFIAIFLAVVLLYAGNGWLLGNSTSIWGKVLYSSLAPAVVSTIAANYKRIKNFIDGSINEKNIDLKVSLAASRYGDTLSFSLVTYSLVFWFRTMSFNIYWSFFQAPMYICLRNCGLPKEERFFFFGSNVFVFDPGTGSNFKLPALIQGSILLFYMWPTLVVVGIIVGGFLLLKTSSFFFRKALMIVLVAILLGLCIESFGILFYWDKIVWQTEIYYMTHGFWFDFAAIATGLILSWFVFFPFRSSDLNRLRMLLSFVPKQDRQKTVALLEDLISTDKQLS